MRIKVHYDQNTFTDIEFSNFEIFIKKKKIACIDIWRQKSRTPSGIRTNELHIRRDHSNPLRYGVR